MVLFFSRCKGTSSLEGVGGKDLDMSRQAVFIESRQSFVTCGGPGRALVTGDGCAGQAEEEEARASDLRSIGPGERVAEPIDCAVKRIGHKLFFVGC